MMECKDISKINGFAKGYESYLALNHVHTSRSSNMTTLNMQMDKGLCWKCKNFKFRHKNEYRGDCNVCTINESNLGIPFKGCDNFKNISLK